MEDRERPAVEIASHAHKARPGGWSRTKLAGRLLLGLVCLGVCVGLGMPALAQTPVSKGSIDGKRTIVPYQAGSIYQLPRLGLETMHINEVMDADLQSGAGFVRVPLEWWNVEPEETDPANYWWTYYDWFFARMAEHGMVPLVRVQNCPLWACPNQNGPLTADSYGAFAQFVGAVATRYSQAPYNVHFYEFWNEPDSTAGTNHQLGWGMHPDKYAQMLGVAHNAIKGVDPQAVIIMGGLAYDGWIEDGGAFNRSFLAGVLDSGGAQYLDAIAFHYYRDNIYGWANIGLKTAAVRAEMSAHGVDLPILSTESGLTSSTNFGSSEAIQARFVVQLVSQGAASGLLAVTWYNDRDLTNPNPGDRLAYAGLMRTDSSIKLSYTAMQTLSQEVGSGAYLRTLGTEDGVGGTLEGYRFRSAGGARQVSVVWNNSAEAVEVTIPAEQASDLRRAVSLYGQEVATQPGPDGTRLVTVGLDPVYLEWNALFSDVTQSSTFYPYVMCLVGRGVISGYSDGTFRPGNDVTRGQIAKVVSNSAGFSEAVGSQSFADVPPSSTFYDYVGRLGARGYIGGYACGGAGEPCLAPLNLPYFRPNANVTRGQLSKIVAEAAGFGDVPTGQQFEDVPSDSTFYSYIYRLGIRSIMQGYSCGGTSEPCSAPGNLPYFRPVSTATRGQASKIVGNSFFPNCGTGK